MQVTEEEEWTDSNNDSHSANEHSINTTLGVQDAKSFQYYKRGTCGTSANDDNISQLRQHVTTRATSWQHIFQANNLHGLTMANTIFDTIKLKKAVK